MQPALSYEALRQVVVEQQEEIVPPFQVRSATNSDSVLR